MSIKANDLASRNKWRLRHRLATSLIVTIALVSGVPLAKGLDGAIRIHDPSTVIVCDGKYYVFGTGGGVSILVSNDGFTWRRGGRVFDEVPQDVHALAPKNNGRGVWAPDIIQTNGQYCLYYAVSAWNDFVSAIGLMTSPTLDSTSANYKWTDRGVVVNSVQGEDLNAIDPGVLKGPDGRMWLCYGSYHGKIELVELNPKTGGRIAPGSPVWIIAGHSEASDIIYHDGNYYLFLNHGSCCQGEKSTYNIRVGRSANVTGPYLDRQGHDLVTGGGTLFLGSNGRQIGPGHFGRLVENGVEKFSCHYEADLDHGGRSVLEIRPLLWTADGWPTPGENLKEGTYQIKSDRTKMTLQGTPGANQSTSSAVNLSPGAPQDPQNWLIAPAGGGYYKIINSQSGSALEALPADASQKADDAVDVSAFHGADNQLWKINQFTDGSYRLQCRANKRALTTVASKDRANTVVVRPLEDNNAQKWVVIAP
jgi:arabinan endo-1,5-alpha-L-arabinosidase